MRSGVLVSLGQPVKSLLQLGTNPPRQIVIAQRLAINRYAQAQQTRSWLLGGKPLNGSRRRLSDHENMTLNLKSLRLKFKHGFFSKSVRFQVDKGGWSLGRRTNPVGSLLIPNSTR
jgi:hypothetical protein